MSMNLQSIEVIVDSGPQWLQYLSAAGTAGAAVFAGWAALATRSAAQESRRLVELELAREARVVEESEWRHARRVAVDLVTQPITLSDGRMAHDFRLSVMNAGTDPILKARIKVVMGDGRWGPQLIGTIAPRREIGLTARIITEVEIGDNINGYVRFYDTEGKVWIVAARGPTVRDDEPVDSWIEEAREYVRSPRTAEERGAIHGREMPNFDAWRAAASSAEAWTGEEADGE